jgi:hypothetical protein
MGRRESHFPEFLRTRFLDLTESTLPDAHRNISLGTSNTTSKAGPRCLLPVETAEVGGSSETEGMGLFADLLANVLVGNVDRFY